jgi:hypothetical protein
MSWSSGHLELCAKVLVNIFKKMYEFVSDFIMSYIVVCEGIEILGDFLLSFLWYVSRDFYLIWVSTLCFIFS